MIQISAEIFPLAVAFTISRGAKTVARVVTVKITRDGVSGWGEAVPYARYGETVDTVLEQLHGLPADISRQGAQAALPAGAARNALDCALWDWQAKATGRPVWDLAGCARPVPQETAYTLSLDTPQAMERAARQAAARPVLKIKLGTRDDVARLAAVRRGAPNAKLIVDANEGWDAASYTAMIPHLQAQNVALVEQPLPVGADQVLADLPRPVPICADESCHISADLPALIGKYDAVNIKLDKTGGLTEALKLHDHARALGFDIMIGCMVGSSLAMAPAMLLSTEAAYLDLDGPLLLAQDRETPLRYDGSIVHPAPPALWG
jgi:L-alanine-DL-glutamate epimerase-like enolase superfamily enzyme